MPNAQPERFMARRGPPARLGSTAWRGPRVARAFFALFAALPVSPRLGSNLLVFAPFLVALSLAGCQPSATVPPGSGESLSVPGGIARISKGNCALPGQVIITTPAGEHFQVKKPGGYVLQPLPGCPPAVSDAIMGMLDDGIVGRGKLTIAKAWLAAPTRRYGHGVLGDAVEASELRVEGYDGNLHIFTLGADSVFEDLAPRVIDLDGDGHEEVLVVRSRLNAGASTAIFEVQGESLKLLAESKPIGQSNRWLNPVGVADFDGDGRREIAVVITPHIGGTLVLYERKDDRLVVDHTSQGYSNHAIGSRELGMSAIVDLNEDGVPDLVVPGPGRKSLRIVTFAGGKFAELRNLQYGAEILTAIELANFGTQIRPDLVFGLKGGTLVIIRR